jgi:MinD superfamily P-loop ATPase
LEAHEFRGGKKAFLDRNSCTGCGECVEVCRFDAISEDSHGKILIDPISCEGCGICHLLCPADAITMEENVSGEWFISATAYGPMVHAKLGAAQENSGKLVTLVRRHARMIAERDSLDLILIDGPPGIGCPVIASLSGVDIALVVTEPTLSGIHDLERVAAVANHFGVNVACVINKHDVNLENSRSIQRWCGAQEIPVLGTIPYDRKVSESLVSGMPLVAYSDCPATRELTKLWRLLTETAELRALR